MGAWMKRHGEAIHGTTASPFENAGFRATSKGKRLNCFLAEWPASREIVLPALRSAPRRAWMLGDEHRAPLASRSSGAGVTVSLPAQPPDALCSVVALEFDSEPTVG